MQRQRVTTALLLVLGACLGASVQAIVWVALTALNHHAGWDRHWLPLLYCAEVAFAALLVA